MTKFCLIIITCIYPSISLAGWFGPSNYDECVLESMKGVTSDMAARAIILSCRDKFPRKKSVDSEVPINVVSQLDGRAGMTIYGYFKGTIYNGNNEWTITQITVAISPKTKDKSQDPPIHAKEYNVDLSLPPLTESEFSMLAESRGSSELNWKHHESSRIQ
jgi:hypothetical protein